ncbi:type VII secretion target [Mycobacterium sp. ACS4331]|uniref:type VII secretion target n=1 Tax=Mycobacterium sp. ACS4331 TaxID=1834121 RepID=UPI0007FEF48C|nr:type VII secretion target [Mycobacterium sp. ACS4331]OBF09987.1 hypothetical protein A5727_22105 [Mycobacterium sp. ACS4331]
MGQQDVRADQAALRAVAEDFEGLARTVSRAAQCPLRFGGGSAGRAHSADGDAWRRALDHLIADCVLWARAADEVAMSLHTGLARYREADRFAAAALG